MKIIKNGYQKLCENPHFFSCFIWVNGSGSNDTTTNTAEQRSAEPSEVFKVDK